MKLIIDIPEEVKHKVYAYGLSLCPNDKKQLIKAIRNGTPLPKGHGRLIDADAELEGLRKMKVVDEKDKQSVRFAILEYENAPTIIEADE